MSLLLEPYTLRQLTLPNRIAVSPMCQYSAVDGLANDWHLVHLGSRAVGGAGLVITEAVAVTAGGRITAEDLGLWDDAQIAPLQPVAKRGAVRAIAVSVFDMVGNLLVPNVLAQPGDRREVLACATM